MNRLIQPIRRSRLRRLNRPVYLHLLAASGLFGLTGLVMLTELERWERFPSTTVFVSHRAVVAQATGWLMIAAAILTLLVAFRWPRWAWFVLTADVGIAAAWTISYVYAWLSNPDVPLAPAIVWAYVTSNMVVILGLPRNLDSVGGERHVREAFGPDAGGNDRGG